MKEILSLFIGQAGVQTGSSIFELFCVEHHLTNKGKLIESQMNYECSEAFFQETSSNSWVPRSLFVDLEPSVIDEVRTGSYRELFHPDKLLSGSEGASNNFARGFFTVGKLILKSINTEFRHLIEQCDMPIGILLFRSLGGGTGAGLTSAMFENFTDYSKISIIEIPIYPSPTISTSMVEPYNCLLGEHFCMEDIDVGLLMDNEAMFDLCSKYLSLPHPTYITINRLIAQIISSITASSRFESVLNCDLTVLQTNLIPYPRIHFPLCNFAPFMSQERANHEEISVNELTRLVFERDNQMIKVDHFYGKFMCCTLLFRGTICPQHVYMALSNIKNNRSLEFVDWCPTGFKVGINLAPPVVIPDSKLADTKRNVTMLTNTSAVGQAWQRLTHKFFLLFSKKSFVHWFVGEGMEEFEFTESLYNISTLVRDYEEAGAITNMNEITKEKKVTNVLNTKELVTNPDEIIVSDSSFGEWSSSSTGQEELKAIDEMDNNKTMDIDFFKMKTNIKQHSSSNYIRTTTSKEFSKSFPVKHSDILKDVMQKEDNINEKSYFFDKNFEINAKDMISSDISKICQNNVNNLRFSKITNCLELSHKVKDIQSPLLMRFLSTENVTNELKSNMKTKHCVLYETVKRLVPKIEISHSKNNIKSLNNFNKSISLFQHSSTENHKKGFDEMEPYMLRPISSFNNDTSKIMTCKAHNKNQMRIDISTPHPNWKNEPKKKMEIYINPKILPSEKVNLVKDNPMEFENHNLRINDYGISKKIIQPHFLISKALILKTKDILLPVKHEQSIPCNVSNNNYPKYKNIEMEHPRNIFSQ